MAGRVAPARQGQRLDFVQLTYNILDREPDHMSENMVAARGELPDAKMRREMVRWVEAL